MTGRREALPAEQDPPATHGSLTRRPPGAGRRRAREAVQLMADGTGRSEAGVQWLFVTTAASAGLALVAAASRGVVRLIDLLTQG